MHVALCTSHATRREEAMSMSTLPILAVDEMQTSTDDSALSRPKYMFSSCDYVKLGHTATTDWPSRFLSLSRACRPPLLLLLSGACIAR
jgi:hypothetical protein